jgi:hypothetical protein
MFDEMDSQIDDLDLYFIATLRNTLRLPLLLQKLLPSKFGT